MSYLASRDRFDIYIFSSNRQHWWKIHMYKERVELYRISSLYLVSSFVPLLVFTFVIWQNLDVSIVNRLNMIRVGTNLSEVCLFGVRRLSIITSFWAFFVLLTIPSQSVLTRIFDICNTARSKQSERFFFRKKTQITCHLWSRYNVFNIKMSPGWIVC